MQTVYVKHQYKCLGFESLILLPILTIESEFVYQIIIVKICIERP